MGYDTHRGGKAPEDIRPSHGVRVVYEDNHVLVALKPYNLPSQLDSSGDADMLTVLKAYIKEKYHKPGNVYLGLVHRLDRPAGGLMLFARTSKAAARLTDAMKKQEIRKEYMCRCEGVPGREKGSFTDWMLKDGKTNTSRIVDESTTGAKKAVLDYEVLGVDDGKALCGVRLHTGRPHQIRVQFASRNMPLVGDAKYGSGGYGNKVKQLALWAYRLGFVHPVTKEDMFFERTPAQPL